MKILIDECLPKRLKRDLPGHISNTIPEMGWAGKKNGELLRLMSGAFDVFLPVDQNMQYQQNLSKVPVAFVVLVAPNNKLETLAPLMPQVRHALETIQQGQVVEIKA